MQTGATRQQGSVCHEVPSVQVYKDYFGGRCSAFGETEATWRWSDMCSGFMKNSTDGFSACFLGETR